MSRNYKICPQRIKQMKESDLFLIVKIRQKDAFKRKQAMEFTRFLCKLTCREIFSKHKESNMERKKKKNEITRVNDEASD